MIYTVVKEMVEVRKWSSTASLANHSDAQGAVQSLKDIISMDQEAL